MLGTLLGKIWEVIASIYSHPYVDVEMRHVNYSKHCEGLVQTSKEPVYVSEVVGRYDFVWNYKLIIKNNSTKPVLYVKIEDKPSFLEIRKELSIAESLQPFKTIELDCTIRHSDTMSGKESTSSLKSYPYFVDTIEIVLSYQNERHKSFYTTFRYDKYGQSNEHKKTKK